jgi:broad specificity phosphatase PhoE
MDSVVMMIRHAEKPLTDTPPHGVTADGVNDARSLTPRGWQRAGALVPYFVGTGGGTGSSGLPVPSRVFASRMGLNSSSARPLETVQPLASRLGLAVDTRFLKGDTAPLAQTLAKIEGVALVSWEHHVIPSIAEVLVGREGIVPTTWPDDRFDVVWVFERSNDHSEFTFRQVPQLLLAGDKVDLIVDAAPDS